MDHNGNLSVILLDDTSLCDAKEHLLARLIPYNCAHARNRKRATSHALRMVSPILCHDVLLRYDTISNAKLSIFDRYGIQQSKTECGVQGKDNAMAIRKSVRQNQVNNNGPQRTCYSGRDRARATTRDMHSGR
jgi:hypothetical protein